MRVPEERVGDFDEAKLGLSERAAILEAERCRLCTRSPCVAGCPVEIDIPRFIAAVRDGQFDTAYDVITEQNALPAICGRVCAQDEQCEVKCILERKHDPIAIGELERFVGDWGRSRHKRTPRHGQVENGSRRRVAIVGSGPAGLTAAEDLASAGYKVTIFEALHRLGGVLAYGIPRFRLPLSVIDEEIANIIALGVEVRTNFVVGRTATLDELAADHDAIFLATGTGLPWFLGVDGESLVGVYSGNEFLMRVNLMGAHDFPEKDTPISVGERVVVIGGGDTSLDCARAAVRLGAHATLMYRRTRELMPARAEEIDHALEEGVEFEFETTVTRFVGEPRVSGVECIRLAPGEPDGRGRARPEPVPGSEFTTRCDSAIVAIGFGVNPTVTRAEPGLAHDADGVVWVDDRGATSKPTVFAGGDLITGGATVILAMAQGRRAARSIDAFLRGHAEELEVRSASWL